MHTYSKELVIKLQKYFKENYNEKVIDNETQIYLESFITLFLSFKKIKNTVRCFL